jgi:hypothetical protein
MIGGKAPLQPVYAGVLTTREPCVPLVEGDALSNRGSIASRHGRWKMPAPLTGAAGQDR